MNTRRSFLGLGGAFVLASSVPVRAQSGTLHVGMIPDAGATAVSVDQKAPLRDYLAHATGRDVQLIIPTNYNATVEALGNGSLDIAYLGGLTYCQAHVRYAVVPLVQRSSDRAFHSLFITGSTSRIQQLTDLRGKKFAFGDINSTSGHLMPYYELRKAGIDPDRDLSFRYTGNHIATAKAVSAGVVDAGALDESVFATVTSDGTVDAKSVRVFYTTPPFVDYVWVARKDLAAADQERVIQAFLALNANHDAQVLDILRGKSFVRADDAEYDTLRGVAKQLGLL